MRTCSCLEQAGSKSPSICIELPFLPVSKA
nr:MAG TPA: hypothetical protein [Caudoviricetes sp.]DAR32693.1 MAG TPA: hypothetical protein [Caudoviricetes sp.]